MDSRKSKKKSERIELQKLGKKFYGEAGTISVLENLDLAVDPGSMISIEGASGSGKSTLLNIMGTMDSPTSGQLYYGKREISQMKAGEKEKFRAQTLGFIFQQHYLLPDFSILENTMMPLLLRRCSWSLALEESKKVLEMVDLGHRLSHYPSQISGGEMSRASVARALVGDKSLILADEPTGNLDRKNSEHLAELLWELQDAFGFTLVLVTHDRDLAARIPIRYQLASGSLERIAA